MLLLEVSLNLELPLGVFLDGPSFFHFGIDTIFGLLQGRVLKALDVSPNAFLQRDAETLSRGLLTLSGEPGGFGSF